MIGMLTTQKCAACKTRRLWLILIDGIAALICGPCDLRADRP